MSPVAQERAARRRHDGRAAGQRVGVWGTGPRQDDAGQKPAFQVLERTFGILEVFTEARPEWSTTDIARSLDLPVPTVHRILAALRRLGYVSQHEENKRFRLGLGVSHRATMEGMLGLRLAEPLSVMREYVAVLRGALGRGARFVGRHYRVEWSMTLPGLPPAPPVLLAGLSPKMLELAGEVADGVVLWLCTPRYIRETALPALERGRRRAGKTLEGFEIVAAVPLAITDDPAGALGAFREELVRYLALPFYRAMLEESGFGEDVGKFDRDRVVPERLAGALGGIGPPKTARAYVQAYRDAGVTLPAVRPITFPDAPWSARTLDEALAG